MRISRTFLSAIAFVVALWASTFQVCGQLSSPSSPPGGYKKPGATQSKDSVKPIKPGSAWTLSTPLGIHKKSTIDTLLYNYQRQSIPSLRSDAMATTGNLGAEAIDMIFFNRPERTTFFFSDALDFWIPSQRKTKFFNVYTPMTLLSYNFGGSKVNHQDRLTALFAGNVNRNIGIGAHIDYLYAKGYYSRQAAKNLNFGLTAYYTGNRYEMQTLYYHYYTLNQENGGTTDDRYITDPAEVQGGVEKVDTKIIPVRLSGARNRLVGNRIFSTHALKLGYWDEEQVNDTLVRDIYIPVTKFIYSLEYVDGHHGFTNSNPSEGKEIWGDNCYMSLDGTSDQTRYWHVNNTIGVQLLEGFRRWAKFGIDAYATLQTRRITQANYDWTAPELPDNLSLTPLPKGVDVTPRVTQNRMWVGGTISKRTGAAILYSADAKFGILGGVAGDINLRGDVSSRFRLFGDTVSISAYGGFANQSNSYFLSNYISNHFAWKHKLGKTRTIKAGGQLLIPWTKTSVKIGFANMQNYVYFNKESLPTQNPGNVQVFSASLEQKLRFGIWNWNNTLTYQASSDQSVIPLPALTIYSNMFLNFKAFKVLEAQIGIDCSYYTKYYAPAYQPATMTFHTQDEMKCGNYAFCNAYATMKLYKVRFYVLYSHVNQGWFSKNYFSLPHYPLNPRTLQFGLSVDFAD